MKIRRLSIIFSLVALVGLFAGCAQPSAEPTLTPTPGPTPAPTTIAEPPKARTYTDVDLDQMIDMIKNTPGLIIVDVSTYYLGGHVPGAIWLYTGDGSLQKALPDLDPNAIYLCYGHSRNDSRAGAGELVLAGFPNVYRFSENYRRWRDAGLPLEYGETVGEIPELP